MIIVDTREFRSKVVKELFSKGIIMQSLMLGVGDYLIGKDVCVERKSVKDFVNSLVDKRIFTQLRRMKDEFRNPLLIVEGAENIFSVRKVHPNSLRGLLLSISVDYNIPVLFSRDEAETADFLELLIKRGSKEPGKILKTEKKILTSDVQESIACLLPGIGVKTGESLLKRFKTLKNLFNAGIDELMEVDGVGKKTAEEIHKTFNKEYED